MRKCLVCLAFMILAQAAQGQQFENRIGLGTLSYFVGVTAVKPNFSSWQGYNLPREPNTGFQVTGSNGFVFDSSLFLGAGLSYCRYAGYNGFVATCEIAAGVPRGKKVAMLAYIAPGISHFWNQYPGGTTTGVLDFGLGVCGRLPSGQQLRFSAGVLGMQQNLFLTARLTYSL